MLKRFILAFAILSLVAAIAGTRTAPGALNAKISLLQTSVVKDTELKAGEYRISMANDKLTIANEKTSVEAAAKTETVDRKFESTAIRYTTKDGKAFISEIRVGGTNTKIVLNP
jgi:hypothetical protein